MENKTIKITCKGQRYIDFDDLLDFQGNLKEIKKQELEKLKRSILKHGFSFPVFIWGSFILDGHQRIYATKELIKDGYKIDPIPIVEIDAKDEKEAGEKLLLINSNYAKISENGLKEYIEKYDIDIDDLAGDLSLVEIDLDEFIEGLNKDVEGLTNDDSVPEIEEETKTKTGDLYVLGEHRLMCGDAVKEKDVERLMGGQIANMIFTDPPYNVNYSGKRKNREKIKNDNLKEKEFNEFLLRSYKNMFKYTIMGGGFMFVMEINHGWRSGLIWKKAVLY